MTTCPSCSATIPDSEEFCSRCGAQLDESSLMTETGTPSDVQSQQEKKTPSQSAPSAIGITSDIQGGRGEYSPGAILAGRYRVVGLLGRGGMGSVYRADDLTLGQPVALKFLPEELAGDISLLERFQAEVRVSRQVSHPNVCRVHDIGEADGRVFLSMELVDGGDLSSLLKRVGRLPTERGLEIARQLCAGLAAAHDRGVLHRDLKPANVMIDSEGRVRIADFGLAAFAGGVEGSEIRSGTPAYMAPETLSGREVTARSDLYALGLVLYELFTGKRAVSGGSVEELTRKHMEVRPQLPSEIVPDLDPEIERTILQCLEKDPNARPKSALAISMMLPGGDPLAAALAAGETPSPELVAQAGDEGTLKPLHAWLMLVGIVGFLVAAIVLNSGHHILDYTPMSRPPEVQFDRALETLEKLGVEVPRSDHVYGFRTGEEMGREINRNGASSEELDSLRSGEISVIEFWLRAAPEDLVARIPSGRVSPTMPARTKNGEVFASFSSLGRLGFLEVVPEARLPSGELPLQAASEQQWNGVFVAAGLDPGSFERTRPHWSPPQYLDELRAWSRRDHDSALGIDRVEAGLRSGRVAYVRTGTRVDFDENGTPELGGSRLAQSLNASLVIVVLVVGVLAVRRNLRRGRGDLRGSWRLAGVIFVLGMTSWLASANHARGAGDELELFVLASGVSLFMAAFVWLLYLTLEPEVRRHWPQRLISWQRLLSKSYRDPLVGRHVLIGLFLGSGLYVVLAVTSFFGKILNPAGFELGDAGVTLIINTGRVIAAVLSNVEQAIFAGVFMTVLVLLGRLLLRRTWAAVALTMIFFVGISALSSTSPLWIAVVATAVLGVVMVGLLRYGLLTLMALVFVLNLLQTSPSSFSMSSWYVHATLIPLLVVLTLAAASFAVSLGKQQWFGLD